jgi:LemA protein
MVRYRNKVKESLRLIDIQLKLRFDLIPNLVTTVKAYSKHENEVFSKLIELRKQASETNVEKEKLEYANETVPKIRQVLIIAEDYPELKADSMYKSLMDELILIEDKIAASRRFYDSNVNEYNTLIGVFPNNIIASLFGFTEMELFKIDVGENFSSKVSME